MSTQDIASAVGRPVTMRYEEGGKVQVFVVGDAEYRFPGYLSTPQIIEAIKSAEKGDA